MSILETIKTRRSIRRFTNQAVPDSVLQQILEAAQMAPSWGNTQCWEIIVVKDTPQREKLAATLSPKNPAILATRHAPVVLVVCGWLKKSGYYKEQAVTRFGDWLLFDLGVVSQTICLAAHGLGLGTVIAGAFDHDAAKTILRLPDGVEAATLIPLGYPDQAPGAPKRRAVAEFTHTDFFAKK